MGGYVQNGRTPLLWACYNGHMEVVKLLLAHPDVDINKTNKVRGRGGAGRAEKLGAHYGLRRRAAHLTLITDDALVAGVHCWVGMCRVDTRHCCGPVGTATLRW